MGRCLREGLESRLGGHPFVGDIRGRGLLQAIELVADRDSRAPFDPSRQVHERIKAATMNLGMMVYPSAGCADGVRGDHVLIAPPFNSTQGEIDEIIHRLCLALDRVFPYK